MEFKRGDLVTWTRLIGSIGIVVGVERRFYSVGVYRGSERTDRIKVFWMSPHTCVGANRTTLDPEPYLRLVSEDDNGV